MSIHITHYYEGDLDLEVEIEKDQMIEELRMHHDVNVEEVVCEHSGLISPEDLATWMSQLDPDREEEAVLREQFTMALGVPFAKGFVPQAEYDALQAKLDELVKSVDAAQRLLFLALVKNSETMAKDVQEVTNASAY